MLKQIIDRNYAIKEILVDDFQILHTGEIITTKGQKVPTEDAIQAKLTELQNAEPLRLLREERNRKLAQTDWRASSDLTLSSEWSTYRQALRDLPSTATPTLDEDGNLQNVTWPSEPT
jgi:hypothetical protein